MENHQHTSDKYHVRLNTSPQTVEAEKPVNLKFAIEQGGQNVPLDISHEMKVHLLVVNEDLSWFCHIHPEEQEDGTYTVTETFPHGGKFLLFTDFKPSGAEQTVNKLEIEVQGNPISTNAEVFASKWVSEVNGYRVTLENGSDFKTNRTQSLQVSVEKDGKKLRESDLQQYLGASAHIVMIGTVGKGFLHIHPISDSHSPIYAETHIQKAGTYRMWVQFKIDGQVHTADFTVDVAQGEQNDNYENHHHGHHH